MIKSVNDAANGLKEMLKIVRLWIGNGKFYLLKYNDLPNLIFQSMIMFKYFSIKTKTLEYDIASKSIHFWESLGRRKKKLRNSKSSGIFLDYV